MNVMYNTVIIVLSCQIIYQQRILSKENSDNHNLYVAHFHAGDQETTVINYILFFCIIEAIYNFFVYSTVPCDETSAGA